MQSDNDKPKQLEFDFDYESMRSQTVNCYKEFLTELDMTEEDKEKLIEELLKMAEIALDAFLKGKTLNKKEVIK